MTSINKNEILKTMIEDNGEITFARHLESEIERFEDLKIDINMAGSTMIGVATFNGDCEVLFSTKVDGDKVVTLFNITKTTWLTHDEVKTLEWMLDDIKQIIEVSFDYYVQLIEEAS